MSAGQIFRGAHNNTANKNAQPGQSGDKEPGCDNMTPTMAARYESAPTRQAKMAVRNGEFKFAIRAGK